MDKSEVLTEFQEEFTCGSFKSSEYSECRNCEDNESCDMPKQMQFIENLVEKMEEEKQEAVKGIIDFISDQDSIIDSTYKTYELIQSDIEYIKNKYLKE